MWLHHDVVMRSDLLEEFWFSQVVALLYNDVDTSLLLILTVVRKSISPTGLLFLVLFLRLRVRSSGISCGLCT